MVMSADEVKYLTESMPKKEGIENGYDYVAWAESAFNR